MTRRIKKIEKSEAHGVTRIVLDCGHNTYVVQKNAAQYKPGQMMRCEKCDKQING